MNRTLLAVIFSLAAGFAAGALTTKATPPPGDAVYPTEGFDSAAPLEERIAALEQAVAGERDARLVLEEQLHGLYAELERFESPEMTELLRTLAENSEAREQARAQRAGRPERGARMRDLNEMRTERLVAGGFTEERAQQILDLEDEARMAALQDEYEARRNGETFNPWERATDFQAALRERLGDAEYEKYLTAQGNQASVTVREVIGSSPANRAGLRPGDRILSYDGERVFGMNDLKSMAFSGDPGEDVIVDIERNGQRMQLVLPRGPLGITGSGGGMGFRSPFGG
jgi:C-terminal processing protease CtpA/Prc